MQTLVVFKAVGRTDLCEECWPMKTFFCDSLQATASYPLRVEGNHEKYWQTLSLHFHELTHSQWLQDPRLVRLLGSCIRCWLIIEVHQEPQKSYQMVHRWTVWWDSKHRLLTKYVALCFACRAREKQASGQGVSLLEVADGKNTLRRWSQETNWTGDSHARVVLHMAGFTASI